MLANFGCPLGDDKYSRSKVAEKSTYVNITVCKYKSSICVGLVLICTFSLCYFASGFGLSHQRRLLTQQRTSDWDHHQTPPHRGQGRRQGADQRRHLRRVRSKKKSRCNLFLSKGRKPSPTPGWFLMMFLCATGFWCSSSKTKCAWNSSREAQRTATARPASARTTGCWRCRCPWRHSAAPSSALQCCSNAQIWGAIVFF